MLWLGSVSSLVALLCCCSIVVAVAVFLFQRFGGHRGSIDMGTPRGNATDLRELSHFSGVLRAWGARLILRGAEREWSSPQARRTRATDGRDWPQWPSCRLATVREGNLWRVGRREGDLHGTNPGNRSDARGT
ncbi:hypothetical protein [Kibdelosporangium philippinense]|uniref:hypothetical protein n=1 Tax=Kibdelosporangium philippinense TaxID=211113 RepID=UPI00361D7AB7